MSSDADPRRYRRMLLLVCVLIANTAAHAASGFVSETKISRVGNLAAISITFNCDVEYLGHEPNGRGNQARIQIEPTTLCTGVSPLAANTQERFRPADADLARLIDIEYDGESGAVSVVRLTFAQDVGFSIEPFANARNIIVRVLVNPDIESVTAAEPRQTSHQVRQPESPQTRFVVNLQSSTRPPATADFLDLQLGAGLKLMISEAVIDEQTWYRARVGFFDSAEHAAKALAGFREQFPTAWIDQDVDGESPGLEAASVVSTPVYAVTDTEPVGKLDELMLEARQLMTAGELSRAIQIYTKVLQQSPNRHQPAAQEFLALARERNGQIAHAKAEYQRFLATYPDNEGVSRVRQRLAAMLAQPRRATSPGVPAGRPPSPQRRSNDWSLRSYVSQYYRRDVNQLNDAEEIVSQSALYSDVNFDARRRGTRFDFSARLTAGYRKDFLDQPDGNETRVSYAFADLADTRYNLRGRFGRQSRNTGGVLGRFDGVNVTYQATERLKVDGVVGKPVNSTADDIDSGRTFYGISSNFTPDIDNLDLGVFFIQQGVEHMTDRQAVGAEVRYFGENKSVWGLVDYDTSFKEVGSLFLQGSWRLPSDLTLTGLLDRRRAPLLSMNNAIIGQPVSSFDELVILYTEDEIRRFALDRAPTSTTITLGLSRPLTPKFQINVNASQSVIDATPESGGVLATPKSTYIYVSTDLVGSSLIKEGDVSLFGFRYADSDNTEVFSVNLDTRFPIGRSLRFNPRIRVDYRTIKSDRSTQWIYTPGLRLQYRADRRFRIELEAGMQISTRDRPNIDEDRESYFINLGYQLLY